MIPDFTSFEFPAWAVSDEAKVWLCGFIVAAMVRIFRAALRWFKRAGTDTHSD